MCGIAGFLGRKQLEKNVVQPCLDLMDNRGPDAKGQFQTVAGDNCLTLLHSRLSIIDLGERANQPFVSDGLVLVYNGEIYNYVELREELKALGCSFQTASDTEVLVKSWRTWGAACLDRFEGMWSFALWDKSERTLYLSRDRFGEKPLYYLLTNDGIYFGSEVKFLAALSGQKLKLNHSHLLRYMIYGYKSLHKVDASYFENVFELPIASLCTLHHPFEVSPVRYWTPRYSPQEMTVEEAVEGTRAALINSMRLRLRADVPQAFCLSGGIDSSSLVSIAAKEFGAQVSTFSIIDSDERYNEQGLIEATIKDIGCESTFIQMEGNLSLDRLKKLIHYHDAPIVTISYFVHSLLSEAISETNNKVVFSGTAADELFTGYYDHFNLHLYELRNHVDYQRRLDEWKQFILPIVRNPALKQPDLYLLNPDYREHLWLNSDVFRTFLNEPYEETFSDTEYTQDSLLRNRMMNELFHEATRVILHEDDLNSMMYSLENRSPYLDRSLFEFAYTIPPELLIQNGYGKYILREAVSGFLNDTVRLTRQKKGFNASIFSLFDFTDPEIRACLLDDSPVFDVINREEISELLAKEQLPNSYSKFLFNFINLRFFMEMYA
jgi:asparagine synthase (glutamine-hydrolysing)